MALSPLLVDAKHEYTVQLADLLAPYAMNTIARIYEASNKSTKAFRELLRQVPNWNASQIDERTNEIERRNPQLQDLIAACCVSYTKVLGSIRLNQSQNSNVRIALPQSTAFVHNVHVAKEFYHDHKLVFADRHAKAALMRDAVDESIRQHVPIQQLLQAYLHVAVDAEGMDPMAAAFQDQPLPPGPAAPEASPYHTPVRSPMMAAYQPEMPGTQQMPIMVPAMAQMPQMQPQMMPEQPPQMMMPQMQPQMQPQMMPEQPQMQPQMPEQPPQMQPQMEPQMHVNVPEDAGPRPEFFDDADFA